MYRLGIEVRYSVFYVVFLTQYKERKRLTGSMVSL